MTDVQIMDLEVERVTPTSLTGCVIVWADDYGVLRVPVKFELPGSALSRGVATFDPFQRGALSQAVLEVLRSSDELAVDMAEVVLNHREKIKALN
jgi:hypothetical protein